MISCFNWNLLIWFMCINSGFTPGFTFWVLTRICRLIQIKPNKYIYVKNFFDPRKYMRNTKTYSNNDSDFRELTHIDHYSLFKYHSYNFVTCSEWKFLTFFTHFASLFHFYIFWKRKKTKGFLTLDKNGMLV